MSEVTVFCEQAEILSHQSYPGAQWVMRVLAPKCAAMAKPGQFAHITCHPSLPMKRPISIMRTGGDRGWVDFLYKVVGKGTDLLRGRVVGESIHLMGPIGQPFSIDSKTQHHLLIGGGVGMPPMIHLAESLKKAAKKNSTLVLLGSEVPFPFRPQPSIFMLPGWPPEVIGAMPLLEDWGIPSRLASLQDFPGCFQGYITALSEYWLKAILPEERAISCLYACGPAPMLQAVAKLSAQYHIQAQLSFEENMACGIGGCAGCTVEIVENNEKCMKRVCVDGPVFAANAVYPEFFAA